HDAEGLALPRDQDKLIAAVTAANPRSIVVLETGNPVAMPWRDQVGAVIEAWYPGQRGGEAIANVLFGAVNPSGRLPSPFRRARRNCRGPMCRAATSPGTRVSRSITAKARRSDTNGSSSSV